uniref:NADH dehydrogenase subunit 2 n=1 Tax=Bostrychia moritziana TaxID=103713 RepID=UPI002E786B1E|nr:NADH dehydrogenase subunit 2 [Bostrychia moritziana]WQF69398.1 NADH dehydrogenase subunit 2 [Bostrychia moritziana]
MNNFLLDIYSLLGETFLFFNICLILLFGTIFSGSLTLGFPILSKSVKFLSMQTIILFYFLVNQIPIFMISWNNLIIIDSFSFYSKSIIGLICFLFISFLIGNKNNFLNFEFWILLLLSILALCFLIQAYNILIIYLSIEFLSLIFYILASLKRDSEFSTEAGIKYFILGAFSSALLLFGFALLYNLTGITNLQDFLVLYTNYGTSFVNNKFDYFWVTVSLLFILASFLFKLGSAPFHFWLPDVYDGASSKVTAFFAIIPKLGILSIVSRFYYLIFFDLLFSSIYYFLIICVFLSSLFGTFGAFYQKKWKRFIAFSSINHSSFFLICICSNNLESLQYLFIYLFIYLFMTIGFFSFFCNFRFVKYPNIVNSRYLSDLNCLSHSNNLAAISMSLILFSMAGIPPLAGFFTKFFVLLLPISDKFLSVVFFVLVLNCIACYYYINIIKIMYFNNVFKKNLPVTASLSYCSSVVLGLCILIIILFLIDLEDYVLFTNLMFSFVTK